MSISAALGAAAPAWATGLPELGNDAQTSIAAVEVIKSPGPPPVTTTEVTRGGAAAYTVTINALPGALNEKLNNFKFYGTTAVTASGAATFVSATGASCVPDIAGTAITCSVPGEFAITALPASVSFTVVFKAPTNVDATKITFSGYSTYADYVKNYRRTGWVYTETEKTNTATADTPLIAPSTTGVSTYVPTSTTTDTALYTGTLTAGGVVGTIPIVSAFVNDPLTTTIVVPANSTATTVYVLEDESGLLSSCNVNPQVLPVDDHGAGKLRLPDHHPAQRQDDDPVLRQREGERVIATIGTTASTAGASRRSRLRSFTTRLTT